MVCVSEVFIGFMALDFIGICRLVTFFFGNVCKKSLRRALFCLSILYFIDIQRCDSHEEES